MEFQVGSPTESFCDIAGRIDNTSNQWIVAAEMIDDHDPPARFTDANDLRHHLPGIRYDTDRVKRRDHVKARLRSREAADGAGDSAGLLWSRAPRSTPLGEEPKDD